MTQGLVGDTYRIQGMSTRPYGMPSLSLLLTWGTLATISLGLAIISAYSSASRPTAADSGNVQSSTSPAGPGEPNANTRRMIEAVRTRAADREQLLTRMASLERNLADVTGSIKRDVNAASQLPLPQITSTSSAARAPAADAPASPPEMPPAAATANVPASTPASSPPSVIQAADIAAPDLSGRGATAASSPVRNAPPTETATAEVGVDVGGALNFDSLWTLWGSIKRSNLVLPEELYPLVAVRENNKSLGGVDLRLVIGPLAGAEAAASLCSRLSAEHRYCQPVAFEGQRLSLVRSAPKAGTVSVRRPASGPSQPQRPQ